MTGFAGLALVAMLTIWACNDRPILYSGPCGSTYQGLCGSACSLDTDCPAGLHCSNGRCDALCGPAHPCSSDTSCDDRGHCVDEPGSGGASSSSNGGGGTGGIFNPNGSGGAGGAGVGGMGQGGECGSVEVTFEPQIPTVVLLIDQSGSMDQDFNGQGTRWSVVYNSLMDPANGVVATLQSQVRFGLALYTYDAGPTCPALVEVTPPALDNHATIDAVYSTQDFIPGGDTPTGDSLSAITPALVNFAEPGPKLIILATDGEPDRCEDPDAHDAISQQEAIDAATAAYGQGIETVIIAVGNQVSQSHQQDVANAGAGLPPPPADPCTDPMACAPTYEPATQQGLIDAFTDIINGQRTCVFTLDGQVLAGKECDGTVEVNGQTIPCNDPDGWQLNTASEIEFLGTTCDIIMNDLNVMISASFPCDAIIEGPD